MKIWYCQVHRAAESAEEGTCEVAAALDAVREWARQYVDSSPPVAACRFGEFPMRLIPDASFEVQLSTDEEVESLDLQYWHQDLTDFVWAKGGWAWFMLIPIDGLALDGETPLMGGNLKPRVPGTVAMEDLDDGETP